MRPESVCARRFIDTHPEDAARLIEQQPAAEAATFLEHVSVRAAAGVIERMNQAVGADCLASMRPERSGAVVTLLAPAVTAALLRRMTVARREEVLSILPDETEARFRRLLSYPEDTVGSITDPGVLALPEDVSVGEALRQLRRFHGAAHHHVYVVDRAQHLVGVVHLRDLVGHRHRELLAAIMQPTRAYLAARSRLTTAAAHPAWRELDALPVADDSGVLLGMVRYRQVRHVDSPTGPGSFAGTLLGLGELYWMALSTFLPVVPTTAEIPASTAESPEGDHDHA